MFSDPDNYERKENQVRTILTAICILFTISIANASQYNYMEAEDLKMRIGSNEDMVIIDIQVQDEFNKHHIPGSLGTYAYPVKSAEDRARLSPVIALEQDESRPLVIVCPRGAGGAKRTYDYLVDQGIASDRLWILKKGMAGWDYDELISAVN